MNRPLEISSLTKVFDTPAGPVAAVKDFSAKIAPGQFAALLGHSGCGKSTVLSIVAGLQEATFGGVVVDGKEIDGTSLDRAFVFQSPSLLPWMTAGANVMLALESRYPRLSKRDIDDRARHFFDLAGVGEFFEQLPAELSQGTQQRVAIARALCVEPRYLLLDEPFGMLDAMTRMELQDTLLSLWEKSRKTVIMVTHDVDEALYLADRILLMTDGPEARLGGDLTVAFARPRDRARLARDPEYLRMSASIFEFLEQHTRQFAA